MDKLKQYKIAFTGLSLGKHVYSFEFDDVFFESFENSEITRAAFKLELIIEKSNSMMVLDFNISGKAELICDRCSGIYWQQMESSDKLYVKFGDSYLEQSDEILIIPHNETHIDISQFIYEYIHLNLPLRRIHPGGKLKEDNCDPVVLKKIKEYNIKTDEEGNPKTGVTDQWEVLRKLKNN